MSHRSLFLLFLALGIIQFGCAANDPSQPARDHNDPPENEFIEGLHYKRLDPVLHTASSEGRIEIIEFFLYACPHCRDLEPKLAGWLEGKSDYVDFRRVPAIVGPPWADQARTFYTAERLGILETAHDALLESIHDKGKLYASDRSIMDFFVGQGVEPEDFVSAYNSPEVAELVSQARVMTVRYGLRGVPAVAVNGKYVTAPYFTGSQEAMLEVLDRLVQMERDEQG